MKTKKRTNITNNRVIVLTANILLIIFVLSMLTMPGAANDFLSISPSQANELIQKEKSNPDFVIIDMRTPLEFKGGHIKDAVLIDYYSKTFIQEMQSLDKGKIYLIYCRSANRSTKALAKIKNMGFESLYNMNQGIIGWGKAGFPIYKK